MGPAVDPLHLALFLGPLGVYLILIGAISLLRRPVLVSGGRDTVALGVAISGLVIAGPLQLFRPDVAAQQFGAYVWILLVVLYTLSVSLWVLMMRPRLVVYNFTSDALKSLCGQIANDLDNHARWAGDALFLPKLEMQFHVEPSLGSGCAQLIATGPHQNLQGWKRFEEELSKRLAGQRTSPSLYGAWFCGLGTLMLIATCYSLVANPAEVAQRWNDLLMK